MKGIFVMKRLSALLLAGTLFSGAAVAADLPYPTKAPPPAPVMAPVPMYNWTGFYMGVFGGYSFDHNEFASGSFSDGSGGGSLRTDPAGALLGGTIGYRWQFGHVVLGLQADEAWAGIKGDNDFVFNNTNWFSAHQEINNLGFGQVTAGYLVGPDWLIGVSGGVAWGGWSANGCVDCGNTTGFGPWAGSDSSTAFGWTIQGFTEYALGQTGWSFVTRGGYYDLGSKSVTLISPVVGTPVFDANVNLKGAFVVAGFNWKFSNLFGTNY